MGQWNSVVTSTEKVHDSGQAFNSTVELHVSTLNKEVESNLQFFLGSFKVFLFHHFCFNNLEFIKIYFLLR